MHPTSPALFVALALIAMGAAIMLYNIVAFVRLVRRHQSFGRSTYEIIRHFALLPTLLMSFFLLAYLFMLYAIIADLHLAGNLVEGLIFFGGAIFVAVGTRFQSKVLDELISSRDQLHHEALHDPLTNLANRRLLLDRLEQIFLRSKHSANQQYAVVFLDIDRFKVINDSLGHEAGDQALLLVSQRLANEIRETDTLARYGGDEFMLILDNTSPRQTINMAKGIRKALHSPMQLVGHTVTVSVSFGIALGPVANTTPERMLQNATLALHQGRKRGLGRLKVFKAEMMDGAVKAMQTELDMQRALKQGEFEMHFQPVYALQPTLGITGFESLMRWNHPRRGFVPPDEFIPIAEENGLITDLGVLAVTQSMEALSEWRSADPAFADLRMAVNFSPRQFATPNMAGPLRETCDRLGLPYKAAVVEITESSMMDSTTQTLQKLERIKKDGFFIAIDDFGTGYSSLAYLKHLPKDIIKIDRSFVSGPDVQDSDRDICRWIVLMGNSLGVKVLAEGVETAEQLNFLTAIGCDSVQGFYLSKPLTRARVSELVAQGPQAFLPSQDILG